MGLMICENAGKCEVKECQHEMPHEHNSTLLTCCDTECSILSGFKGSKCIPYVPAIKPFDGAADLLAREQERKMAHVEAIIGKPLTDHPKYCRLSKQLGGLCAKKIAATCRSENEDWQMSGVVFAYNTIRPDWTQCPRPEKQQPVELPKDPLEELIAEISARLPNYFGNIPVHDTSLLLREFAEKVRAL